MGLWCIALPTTIRSPAATMCAKRSAYRPSNQTAAIISVSDDFITRAVMSAAMAQGRGDKPKGKIVATYDYTDADGKLLYQVLRLEPKDFRQRRPDGNGKWIWKLDDRRVPYRLPELLKYPDATIFICEGEKDADRVAELELCATTVAAGKWTERLRHRTRRPRRCNSRGQRRRRP